MLHSYHASFRSLECSIVPVSFGKQRMQNKFLQKILSSTDLGNRNNKLYILYQFILRRNRFNAGGRLLPFMIYCYNFISDKLSFLLTKEKAKNQNMEEVLDDYLSKHLPNSKEDVMNQFRHMTCEMIIIQIMISQICRFIKWYYLNHSTLQNI